MRISASIQAANQLNLLSHIDSNNEKFDQLHIDITDGHFAENISMSFKVIEMLKNNTDYFLDIHLMINDNLKYGKIAFDCGADVVTVHKESTELKDFIKLSEFNKNIGIGLLPGTSNSELEEYLEYAHSVLLLGVNPGFSNQNQAIDLPKKVNDFNTSFPNYSGEIIVDGGVKNEDLEIFEKIGVDVVVQGGAILDNPLSYLNYSKFMQDAIIAALNTKAFPNPKVAAVLTDNKGNIKATGVHHGPGTNHAEIDLLNKTIIDKDDILYVTLEPCFHADSSPSCAVELLNTSLQNIVIGDIDVDPRTNGKSIDLFKSKGLNIQFEYNANNIINPHYLNQKTNENSNTIIGKIASSQNNYIYNDQTEDKYISNDISLGLTHILRASVDGIAIGKNTLLIDSPKLDVRNVNIKDSNPIKIVFWGADPNIDSHILKHSDIYFLTSFTHKADNVIPIIDVNFDLNKLFKNLNINSLLIEGGNYIHKYFTANALYDKFYWFKSTNNIHSGVKLSDEVIESLKNKYKPINKFLLKDNQLTTYTYM